MKGERRMGRSERKKGEGSEKGGVRKLEARGIPRALAQSVCTVSKWSRTESLRDKSPRFIFNLYKLVILRQIYTEYGDTGNHCFPVKG